MAGRHCISLVGKKFGSLRVVERAGSTRKNVLWRCVCDCGIEKVLSRTGFRGRHPDRCGWDCRNRPSFMDFVRSRVVIIDTGCWEWRRLDGRLPLDGYRPYRYIRGSHKERGGKGTGTPISRMVYEAVHGPVPEGLDVLHTCDYVFCVCPDHLYAGTPKQNADDRAVNGKQVFGEAAEGAKLTPAKACAIFERCFVDGLSMAVLATENNVGIYTIFTIVNRKSWRRATQEIAEKLGVVQAELEVPHGTRKRLDVVRALVQLRLKERRLRPAPS